MELRNFPNAFEARVEQVLCAAHEDSEREGWDTRRWTAELKTRIGAMDEAARLGVYSTEHRKDRKHSEFLFDLILLQQKDGDLKRCVLALESEWGGRGAISDDFQKLILARADHRAMIFEADSKEHAEKLTKSLLQEVATFESGQPGDRYLFAAWVHSRGFFFFTHVA